MAVFKEFDPKLSELRRIQAAFDVDNFSGADTPEGKRRHVMLHIGKLLGKAAGVEEQMDHGNDITDIYREEIIPDLLVYAAQLAEHFDVELSDAFALRLMGVAERNGTGIDSARQAMQSGSGII